MSHRTFGLAAFAFAGVSTLATQVATIGSARAEIATCLGDCDGDDVVDAAEVAGAVHAIFDEASFATCPTYDLDDDGRGTAADVVAMVKKLASGCPRGEFAFDKIALAIFPGAEETLTVTVKDEDGQSVDWSAVSSDPSIASVLKTGSRIEVAGIDLGAAEIIVTTQSGFRRKVPVRVYDSTVLDAGEILIRYVDDFVCRSLLSAAGTNASFYRPVVPDGWHALGSLGVPGACRNINGQQWMMVVKEDPVKVTSFDESINGDLPGGGPDYPPRALTFAVGDNEVRGSVGGEDQFDDFSFTLKPGEHLNSAVLTDFAGTFGEVRFFAGTDTGAPPPAFLGQVSMSTSQIGSDYVDQLDLDLGPGVYSISIVASTPQQHELVLNIGSQRSTPPLAAPTGWSAEYYFPRILPTLCEAFWTPVCPQGYIGMGVVYDFGAVLFNCSALQPPSLDEVVCVREDLTVHGEAAEDHPIWSDRAYHTEAPLNRNYDTTTAYLETGTFVTAAEAVANVLAVDLPPLIDVASSTPFPRLTSSRQPPEYSEPIMAKALLVPFTTLLNGKDKYAEKPACNEDEGCTIGWMLENSPFVRMERVQRWHRELWKYNSGGAPIDETLTFKSGVTHADTDTISLKSGVSVTVESGVSFLGTGGKVSATVSFEFGYTSQRSVSEFEEIDTTLSIVALPGKAAAAWRAQSAILVKLHHPQREPGFNSGFEELVRLDLFDSGISANDDYPD